MKTAVIIRISGQDGAYLSQLLLEKLLCNFISSDFNRLGFIYHKFQRTQIIPN